jgi:predicted phosphodiesterase
VKIKLNEIRNYRTLILCLVLFLSAPGLTGQNNDGKPLKVGIIADVQYADIDNYGTRHYRASVGKLTEAVSKFSETDVDFIVILGDFIDNDFTSYKPLIRIIRGINIPVYFVLGNHDFSVREGRKQKVPDLLNLNSRYYSLSRNNWRFIFLDGTDISTFSRRKKDPEFNRAQSILDSLKKTGAPNAHSWNGGIGKKQIEWLEQEIDNSHKAGQSIIVFCHFPIYPENQSENLWNADEIRNIVESRNGKMVFMNGHTHRSNYCLNNGVHYVSLRGMVEMDENSFATAEIYNDSISIKGYGAEKDLGIEW